MLSNAVLSLIRTWAPVVAGGLLTFLAANLHIVISEDTQAQFVTLTVAVLSGGYYLLARVLEKYVPWASVLLGTKPVHVAYPKRRRAVGTHR